MIETMTAKVVQKWQPDGLLLLSAYGPNVFCAVPDEG